MIAELSFLEISLFCSTASARINSSSKCSNCYGPAVLCVKFVLYYTQGWIFELGARGKLPGGCPIFYTCYTETFRWKQVKFFILSGNLLLRESTFQIVNFLKSFHFKFFFVYTLNLLRDPFWQISHNFCFIVTNIWLASDLIECDYRAGMANLWRMRQIWRIGWFEVAHCIPVIVIKKVSLSDIFIDVLLRTNTLWDACYHLERNFED